MKWLRKIESHLKKSQNYHEKALEQTILAQEALLHLTEEKEKKEPKAKVSKSTKRSYRKKK